MTAENNKHKMMIKKIDQIITKNLFNCKFDVYQLKAELNIGISQLYAVTRMEYKDTPGKYLLKRRLDEALILLQNYRFSLTQVAHKTGFNEPSYFSTSFKARFGKNPSEIQNEVFFLNGIDRGRCH